MWGRGAAVAAFQRRLGRQPPRKLALAALRRGGAEVSGGQLARDLECLSMSAAGTAENHVVGILSSS